MRYSAERTQKANSISRCFKTAARTDKFVLNLINCYSFDPRCKNNRSKTPHISVITMRFDKKEVVLRIIFKILTPAGKLINQCVTEGVGMAHTSLVNLVLYMYSIMRGCSCTCTQRTCSATPCVYTMQHGRRSKAKCQ